jgi:hypothetical protein
MSEASVSDIVETEGGMIVVRSSRRQPNNHVDSTDDAHQP